MTGTGSLPTDDGLVQVLDGLALHVDQGVEVALQREPVGDVLVGHQNTAEGMRRTRHAQCALVRPVDQLLVGFDDEVVEFAALQVHRDVVQGAEFGAVRAHDGLVRDVLGQYIGHTVSYRTTHNKRHGGVDARLVNSSGRLASALRAIRQD